jgi:hypothetical protein
MKCSTKIVVEARLCPPENAPRLCHALLTHPHFDIIGHPAVKMALSKSLLTIESV